jgi:hypothetical protein
MDQQYLEYLKKLVEKYTERINWRRDDSIETQKELLMKCEKILSGELPLDDQTISLLKMSEFYIVVEFVEDAILPRQYDSISEGIKILPISDPFIQKLFQQNKSEENGITRLIRRFISHKFTQEPDLDTNAYLQYLYQANFTDKDIIFIVFAYTYDPLFYDQGPRYLRDRNDLENRSLSKFGEYLLTMLQPKKGLLGFKKDNEYLEHIDSFLFEKNNDNEKIFDWMYFQFTYLPESLTNKYYNYLFCKDYNGRKIFNYDCVYFLIEKVPQQIESLIIKAIKEVSVETENQFSIYLKLNEKLNGKYHNEVFILGEQYYTNELPSYDRSTVMGPFSVAYATYLLKQNKGTGKARIEQFLSKAVRIFPHFYKFLDEQYGVDSVPYMIDALFKDYSGNDYFTTIFSILGKYDFRTHLERILDFTINHANAKTREQAVVLLTKFPEEILPVAINLATEKTVNQRITGALLLSELNTEKANAILNDAVDEETNDDTRDIMLESLSEKRFAKPYSLKMVNEMIAKAEARKKLSRWNEKWITEEKLPKLYWKGKKELSTNEVRFLLYRMKRAKGLNSDIEAKQLLYHIDRESSNVFAKAMLVAFQDSNADPKLKYYLTIAGLLGDDDMMYNLNVLFKKNIADKRMKMAEYVVGALAMVGTNKALRSVEVIYRKFINKKPAISSAAKEALTAAANELNISTDELADRIIPNFDFDGLYRNFEVDGEEYRAFINSDFSLCYLNEDNKIRKSVPANISKELKTEFKEIEKEIRDIVKSQSDRLEKYMLEERRWPVADWQNFFFMNPIMFVYALKLVWGVFDKNNTLMNVFYCSEDTSLYNINDEEVSINDDQFVGILHPIYLTREDLHAWHDKVYAMNMATIFPIFERKIFTINETEGEQSFTKQFSGKNVPKGADFVNTFLVRKNWRKQSGDGGRSEFTKIYKDGDIKAYANIDGPAAFYQGGETPATVYDISFMGKHWSDKVKLKDLPALFYSEVMADIDQMVKAE